MEEAQGPFHFPLPEFYLLISISFDLIRHGCDPANRLQFLILFAGGLVDFRANSCGGVLGAWHLIFVK
jgi:hypothetical protein